MATIAKLIDGLFSGSEPGEEKARQATAPAENRVREFANEDVLFWHKRIDNTRVVRKADPAEGGRCWKLFGSVVGAVVILIGVLLPGAYWLHAGYKVQSLRNEAQRLVDERVSLEVKEAALVSPARMTAIARERDFAEPQPSKVIYLSGHGASGQSDSLAMNGQVPVRQ